MRRRRTLAGLLMAVTMMLSVLLVPVAWATPQSATMPVTEHPANDPTAPVTLAHTGLHILVPTVVGLAVLLVGTALVAWAVLKGSRSARSRS